MCQVNLIAVVAAGGNIGPEGGPLAFLDDQEAREWTAWFLKVTAGGTVVVGTNTVNMMQKLGWRGPLAGTKYVCWSRSLKLTPEQFLDALKSEGRPIFIAGGRKVYEIFMPHVEMMFIKRTQAASFPHHKMPDLFNTNAT